MLLGLRTAIYHVEDMDAAKKWYSDLVGHGPYFDEPFYIGFEAAGYELGLHPREGEAPRGDGAFAYWGVADARAAHARLIELGAKPHTEVTDVGDGILVAAVVDPWGNVFGIIENPHFKA